MKTQMLPGRGSSDRDRVCETAEPLLGCLVQIRKEEAIIQKKERRSFQKNVRRKSLNKIIVMGAPGIIPDLGF